MPRTVYVTCAYVVPVEIPTKEEDPEYDEEFDILENHCPATGLVGTALEAIKKEQEEMSCCWGCRLSGRNVGIFDTKNDAVNAINNYQ